MRPFLVPIPIHVDDTVRQVASFDFNLAYLNINQFA